MKRFKADYYNKDYFCGGKRGYGRFYLWEEVKDDCNAYADSIINFYKPRNVLDIGCALGYTMRALKEKGIEVLGCDISEYAIRSNPYQDRVKQCDIRDGLPYQDDEVDVIFSDSTFEHIEQEYIPKVMQETYRVARKGFYLIVPITLGIENKPWGDPSHMTYMPPSYWIGKAYDVGWSIDLRRTTQKSSGSCQNVNFAFYKGDLYSL